MTREEAIEILKANYPDACFEQLRDAVDMAISALKQPEIVRCKECIYASPNGKNGCKVYHFKLYETHEMNANDFCSRAERRTDE